MITRRIFLRDGAVTVLGLSMVPGFLQRAAFAADPKRAGRKIFVAIFQRGGVDGLGDGGVDGLQGGFRLGRERSAAGVLVQVAPVEFTAGLEVERVLGGEVPRRQDVALVQPEELIERAKNAAPREREEERPRREGNGRRGGRGGRDRGPRRG
jgi:hypothetical protein